MVLVLYSGLDVILHTPVTYEHSKKLTEMFCSRHMIQTNNVARSDRPLYRFQSSIQVSDAVRPVVDT